MKRGDIVLCADRSGDFTGKPRPVLIVQKTAYLANKESVIVCPLSTVLIEDELSFRLHPSDGNGLNETSDVRADLVSAVKRSRIGKHVGALSGDEMAKIDAILRDWMAI